MSEPDEHDNVPPITRAAVRLQEAIRDSLLAQGEAHADLDGQRITAAQWRRIARAAARDLGRPVQTLARDGRVWAVLQDWPATDLERATRDAMMRAAMDGLRLHSEPPTDP